MSAARYASRTLHLTVLGLGVAIFLWSAWMPRDRFTWVLEVAPAVIAAAIIAALYPRWRFTPLVLTLIAIHAAILMVGGKYTYAEVPLFNLLRDELGLARNPYDRIGHFAQGFVPALVAREILLRNGVVGRGGWLFAIVTTACLAISALYEFIEWGAAVATGEAADAFLGSQGDVWDTQWDMFLALIGSIAAQLLLSRAHDRQLGLDPPAGPVELRALEPGSIDAVGELRVRPSQRFHIASIAKSIWQASGRPEAWLRAICVGDEPVGFVMLLDPSLDQGSAEEIYIARLMVDARYQGLGFGRQALRQAIAYARGRPGCRRVKLSHMPDNVSVGRYYEREGFRYTGTVDEDGEVEMVLDLEGGAEPASARNEARAQPTNLPSQSLPENP